MKYYEFIDKEPKLGGLVIIEGVESQLAQHALDVALDRALAPEMRDLNLEIFVGPEMESPARIADAINAMPFLADRRVVVVRRCHDLRAVPRREVWAIAQSVPAGNTLILEDLLAPTKKTKPEPFGALAGRTALRIDTTANAETRTRFIKETLERLGAVAEPRVIAELTASEADLGSVKNDLEKLALGGKKITFADIERESLTVEDPKAYQFASLLLEGKTAEALALAFELFANESRGAAVPLLSALATDFGIIWELARPGGGDIQGRNAWRAGKLRAVAGRIGERRARFAYESAVRGFEAVVTGRIDDPRTIVEILTAEIAAKVVRRG